MELEKVIQAVEYLLQNMEIEPCAQDLIANHNNFNSARSSTEVIKIFADVLPADSAAKLAQFINDSEHPSTYDILLRYAANKKWKEKGTVL